MKSNGLNRRAMALALFSIGLCVAATRAQDPAVVNAKTVQVNLDNERVRVLEALLQPGDREEMHSHPACVMIVLSGGKVRNHDADGTVTEVELIEGTTSYRGPVTHWAENIGKTTVHAIFVELK